MGLLNPFEHLKIAHEIATAPARAVEAAVVQAVGPSAAEIAAVLQAKQEIEAAAFRSAQEAAEQARIAAETAAREAARIAALAAQASIELPALVVEQVPGGSVVANVMRAQATVVADATQNATGAAIAAHNGNLEEMSNALGELAIGTTVDASLLPLTLNHRDALRLAAGNGWKTLPKKLIDLIKTYYAVDLEKVRYAENIFVGFGEGVAATYENEIFFPGNLNLNSYDGIHWILHELQHVVQYQREGGIIPFLQKYFRDVLTTALVHGAPNLHDNMELERDADKIANELNAPIFWGYRNRNQNQVMLFHTASLDGSVATDPCARPGAP